MRISDWSSDGCSPDLLFAGGRVRCELVREIVEVHAFSAGAEKHPLLTVEAEGLAATAGWSKVRLGPHAYLTPPEDGFQDFDLVGVRPAHPAEAMQIGRAHV